MRPDPPITEDLPIQPFHQADAAGVSLFLSKRTVADRASTCSHWLSNEETARLNRFRFDRDRELYLVSHCLVRWVLSRYTGMAPGALQFRKNRHGKPCLDPDHGLEFNLSHSHDRAVVAVCGASEVGIDIEKIDTGPKSSDRVAAIARRYFHDSEYRKLEALAGEARANYFFQLWTLKEAYLKARGVGLFQEPATFTFAREGESLLVSDKEGQGADNHWRCLSYGNVPGYALSLVAGTGPDAPMPPVKAWQMVPGEDSVDEFPLTPLYPE